MMMVQDKYRTRWRVFSINILIIEQWITKTMTISETVYT